jgi:sensor histidine kinase regulating citrate/malate metabolism
MLFVNTRELVRYKSGLQMMEMKNAFMLENYHTLESYFTQIAQMKHEIQHHLLAIRELSENEEYERLLKYLSDIQGDYREIEEPIACGNRIIQAILGHAAHRARELGFEMEFEILPLSALAIPDADLVSLFTNLLDNALESCACIPDTKDRWIKVRVKTRPPYLCLSVTNARQGKIDKTGDSYNCTKADPTFHGQGIEIVRRLTEKHNGFASFEHTENTFTAEIALPVE